MSSFHINPATGNAGKCSAEKGRCPFGAQDDHFDSPESARTAYEASMALRHSYSLMSDGTRVPRDQDGSIPLPAGTYYLIPTSDMSLSPNGPLGLGTLNKPYGEDYTDEQAELLDHLSRVVDDRQEEPEAGKPQAVIFQGEPVVFMGDPNMGNNHNGWRDGCIVIGETLKAELDRAGFDLSSDEVVENGVYSFHLASEAKFEPVRPDDVDWEDLSREDSWAVPVGLNGHNLESHQLKRV